MRERQALAVMGVECLNFKRGASVCDRRVTPPSVIVPSTSMSSSSICFARLLSAGEILRKLANEASRVREWGLR